MLGFVTTASVVRKEHDHASGGEAPAANHDPEIEFGGSVEAKRQADEGEEDSGDHPLGPGCSHVIVTGPPGVVDDVVKRMAETAWVMTPTALPAPGARPPPANALDG
jgi:hypothetical protein